MAAGKTVPAGERFLVGAGLPGGHPPGGWRVAVGDDWDQREPIFASAGAAVAALAAVLPLVHEPRDGIREWVRAELVDGEFGISVESLPPEEATVWVCGAPAALENFIASRRAPKSEHLTAWDVARRKRLVRQDVFDGAAVIEPGAAWFVEWLEARGAHTIYSCEGHPAGFHVAFRGPYELAHAIAGVPRVDVEIFRSGRFPQQGQWCMRLDREPGTHAERDEMLRKVSSALTALPPIAA